MIQVLVVAPSPAIRARIMRTLNGGRYAVTTVATPADIVPGPYQIALVDIRSGVDDPAATVAAVKARAGGVPVVGVSDPKEDVPSALGSVPESSFENELDATAALLGSVLRGTQECKARIRNVLDRYESDRDEVFRRDER